MPQKIVISVLSRHSCKTWVFSVLAHTSAFAKFNVKKIQWLNLKIQMPLWVKASKQLRSPKVQIEKWLSLTLHWKLNLSHMNKLKFFSKHSSTICNIQADKYFRKITSNSQSSPTMHFRIVKQILYSSDPRSKPISCLHQPTLPCRKLSTFAYILKIICQECAGLKLSRNIILEV